MVITMAKLRMVHASRLGQNCQHFVFAARTNPSLWNINQCDYRTDLSLKIIRLLQGLGLVQAATLPLNINVLKIGCMQNISFLLGSLEVVV